MAFVAAFFSSIRRFFVVPNDNPDESIDSQIEPPPPSPSPSIVEEHVSSTSSLPQRQMSSLSLSIATTNLANGEPHRMDMLSWTAIGYCLTAGLEFNAILAQVEDPEQVSFRVKLLSILLFIALYLLIAANALFAKTHPKMAFVMDRLGSAIAVVSSVIAAMPTIPLYVSIGFAAVMIIVFCTILYLHQS